MSLAYYEGNEVEATFSARMVKEDYGVDRSPVWLSLEQIEIVELKILDVEVDPKTLPADLVSAIIRLADDLEFGEEYDGN